MIEVDWQQVKQVLLELEPLLASGNMQAHRVIAAHRVLLHTALGSIGTRLDKHTERFRYPEAMKALAEGLAAVAAHETGDQPRRGAARDDTESTSWPRT